MLQNILLNQNNEHVTSLKSSILINDAAPYLLDKLFSISTHIIDPVPVHSEVCLKCFMLFQQTLLKGFDISSSRY